MPDPSTELEELRRRVEEQSQRIDELQDALHTLSVAVQYREEEPSLAFLAERGIAGRRRVALMMAIAGEPSRAQSEVLPLGSGARDKILPDPLLAVPVQGPGGHGSAPAPGFGPLPPRASLYCTRVGRHWPGVVRTARAPAHRGVHPTLLQ